MSKATDICFINSQKFACLFLKVDSEVQFLVINYYVCSFKKSLKTNSQFSHREHWGSSPRSFWRCSPSRSTACWFWCKRNPPAVQSVPGCPAAFEPSSWTVAPCLGIKAEDTFVSDLSTCYLVWAPEICNLFWPPPGPELSLFQSFCLKNVSCSTCGLHNKETLVAPVCQTLHFYFFVYDLFIICYLLSVVFLFCYLSDLAFLFY